MKLAGKTAIVTGAGSAVARAICLEFARQGARVVAADRDPEVGSLAETMRTAGGEAHFSECDVSDETQVQSMIGDAVMAFGGIDVLVNAAAVRPEGDALALTVEDWGLAWSVNVTSAWLCARYAIPFMKTAKSGAIINVTSTSAERTMPRRLALATTRAALLGLTRSLAIDFGLHGIRTNALMLGWFQAGHNERRLAESADPESEFRKVLAVHPLGRVGAPEEAARAALFLASADASFVNGAVMTVDGGRSVVTQNLTDGG